MRDPKTPSTKDNPMLAPSPYNGPDAIWDSQAIVHNPMYDELGNLWVTARIRPAANPDFCKKGSDLKSAKLFPIATSGRQLAMLDPKTGKFTLINTCFPTHHLEFGYDKNDTLWTSAGGPAANVVGWLNTKMFRETGDEQKSQGWTALIIDTAGLGKREGEYTEPNQPIDPKKQHRINAAFYGVSPSPADNSVWGSTLGYPGGMVRLDPGANPPSTALRGNLRRPGSRLFAACHEHRHSGCGLDLARERPSGELRPPQMQGLERPDGDRQALPGRLDSLSLSRAAIRERDRSGQRRGELRHLGRPA